MNALQRVARPFPGLVLALCMTGALCANAHHILGVPHYAYDENYPQTPVLTYKADLHEYEIELTGFPGNPEPGERCSIHVYIRRLDNGEVLDDTVTLTVTRDRAVGKGPIIYGPVEAQLEESMYKFFPRFDRVADYTLELAFESAGDHWVIKLPMTVGEPKSPWIAVGGGTAGFLALLVIGRALRIKMKRRAEVVHEPALAPAERPGSDGSSAPASG